MPDESPSTTRALWDLTLDALLAAAVCVGYTAGVTIAWSAARITRRHRAAVRPTERPDAQEGPR